MLGMVIRNMPFPMTSCIRFPTATAIPGLSRRVALSLGLHNTDK